MTLGNYGWFQQRKDKAINRLYSSMQAKCCVKINHMCLFLQILQTLYIRVPFVNQKRAE